MKLDIKLQSGSMGREQQIELIPVAEEPARAGRVQFVLDSDTREADWTEINRGCYSILLGGRSYQLHVAAHPDAPTSSGSYEISVGARRYHVTVRDPRRRRHAGREAISGAPQEILAPMPGKIVKILVAENQEVALAQGLLVIEAMKMQNELKAPRSGR
ncbi:MAG TPA: biotin/lipoyl-containing protein, partial [Bryobacteraceae bacterium]|nr:biotin/lipoyl-containing protein [Bryobacteraceae bacterium]